MFGSVNESKLIRGLGRIEFLLLLKARHITCTCLCRILRLNFPFIDLLLLDHYSVTQSHVSEEVYNILVVWMRWVCQMIIKFGVKEVVILNIFVDGHETRVTVSSGPFKHQLSFLFIIQIFLV